MPNELDGWTLQQGDPGVAAPATPASIAAPTGGDPLAGWSMPGTAPTHVGTSGVGAIEAAFEQKVSKGIEMALGNSAVQGVFDILSRPTYAETGAIEALARGEGVGGALKAAGVELASGIAGLQGQKHSFSETLDRLGVPSGGGLSDLVPWIFSPSGVGLPLQRGGFFDFTPRGTGGLILDIALNPVSYLTFGAGGTAGSAVKAGEHFLSKAGVKELANDFVRLHKFGLKSAEADAMAREAIAIRITQGASHLADQGGIKFFGRTVVPGSVFSEPATKVKDGVVRVLEDSSFGRKVLRTADVLKDSRLWRGVRRTADTTRKGLNELFVTNWGTKKTHPDYVKMEDAWRGLVAFGKRDVRDEVSKAFEGLHRKDREFITKWIDSDGKIGPLPDRLKPATDWAMETNFKWSEIERANDLLEHTIPNYILHAYEDAPDKVRAVYARFGSFTPSKFATLRGSQLSRALMSFDDAVKVGLHPIYDSAELMLRRGYRHVDAVETARFFTQVKAKFGQLPAELLDAKGELRLVGELKTLQGMLKQSARGFYPTDREVANISDAAKVELLSRFFARAATIKEVAHIRERFSMFEDFFPDAASSELRNLKSLHGEPMVPVTVRGIKQLRDVLLPAPVAEDVTRVAESFVNPKEVKGLLRGYDVLMNHYKFATTILWPGYHVRNFTSNVINEIADLGLTALNPKLHEDALRILLAKGGRSGSFVSKIGRTWSDKEVYYEAARRGVIVDYRDLAQTIGAKIPISVGKGLGAKVLHPFRVVKEVASQIENEARMSMFVNYLRRGLSAEDAASRMKQFLFDYQRITPAERGFFSRVMPFYRWTRKNIALQVERTLRNPGYVGAQAAFTRSQLADPAMLPKFMRGEINFQVEADPTTGKITTISGVGFPVRDLNFLYTQDAIETLTNWMAQLGGPAKSLIELATDTELYTRRRISEQSKLRGMGPIIKAMPKPVRDWLEFTQVRTRKGETEYHVNPVKSYLLFKTYVLTRYYTTFDRVLQAQTAAKDAEYTTDLLTGIRLNDVDVHVQLKKLRQEQREDREKLERIKGLRRPVPATFKVGTEVPVE